MASRTRANMMPSSHHSDTYLRDGSLLSWPYGGRFPALCILPRLSIILVGAAK